MVQPTYYAITAAAVPLRSDCSPFTRDGIDQNTVETQEGIYVIVSLPNQRWIYVGQGNLRERLTVHLSDPRIVEAGPTHWIAMLCGDETERLQREKWLIQNLRGLVNRQHSNS